MIEPRPKKPLTRTPPISWNNAGHNWDSSPPWGDKGHLEVWIDKNSSWIYPHLHAAAQRMTNVANAHKNDSSELNDRVLKQLARELLLAQASDWAFLMRTGTAREYASKRTI